MQNWNDWRFFLELSRTGRLLAAAQRLQVDHTTVARRIYSLEREVGMPLFERGAKGYALTEAGQRLLTYAEAMENSTIAIEGALTGHAPSISGHVRIGATEGFGSTFLAPNLAELSQRYPDLEVDLLAVPRFVSLSKREADIGITIERPQVGRFVLIKLTDYVLKLYAAPEYLEAHQPIRKQEDLDSHCFINYVDDLLYSKKLRYLDEICRAARVVVRSTSIVAQYHAAIGGAGLAILPSFMAAGEPLLRPVLSREVELTRTFWMITHPELRDLARIKTVWNFLKEIVARNQHLLLGKARPNKPRNARPTPPS